MGNSADSANNSGVLPYQAIAQLIERNVITSGEGILDEQIQPASMDLRLGSKAYRVQASFLPGDRSVEDIVHDMNYYEVPLDDGAVLDRDGVFIVELQEQLALDPGISAHTNPKSSTGRLDVFTRVICDGSIAFDVIPEGYKGKLYAEISPRTFPVMVRKGSRLNQIRFAVGEGCVSDDQLTELNQREFEGRKGLTRPEPFFSNGLALRVNTSKPDNRGIIGFRARRYAGVIDVDQVNAYNVNDFWEPIQPREGHGLILDPQEFYILASKERIRIPNGYAAEMVPFDPMMGEFRVHYAGFFDPGFGMGSGEFGAQAVLEVRSHDVPFLLRDEQLIGRLIFERLSEIPDSIYGQGIGSHYQSQGLKLSKHFRTPD